MHPIRAETDAKETPVFLAPVGKISDVQMNMMENAALAQLLQ